MRWRRQSVADRFDFQEKLLQRRKSLCYPVVWRNSFSLDVSRLLITCLLRRGDRFLIKSCRYNCSVAIQKCLCVFFTVTLKFTIVKDHLDQWERSITLQCMRILRYIANPGFLLSDPQYILSQSIVFLWYLT
jgi:hypothetical protein